MDLMDVQAIPEQPRKPVEQVLSEVRRSGISYGEVTYRATPPETLLDESPGERFRSDMCAEIPPAPIHGPPAAGVIQGLVVPAPIPGVIPGLVVHLIPVAPVGIMPTGGNFQLLPGPPRYEDTEEDLPDFDQDGAGSAT